MNQGWDLGGIAAALAAAHQGGLLRALLEEPATPAELAARLSLDTVATERVLEVLAAFGLAQTKNGRYGAGAELRRANRVLPGGVGFMEAMWSRVPAFLLRGERVGRMDGSHQERSEAYGPFVSALGKMFARSARELAARLPRRAVRILDVGAGSGVWSLEMARRNRRSRVTGLDLPAVLPAFRQLAAELGLADRIDTIAGDFHTIRFPARRFDRVVLANVLHLEPADRAAALVRRAARAVAPGGELLIVDVLGGASPAARRSRAVYALNLAVRTAQGRAHPADELRAWMEAAGLSFARRIEMGGQLHGLGALVARRSTMEPS